MLKTSCLQPATRVTNINELTDWLGKLYTLKTNHKSNASLEARLL